MTWPLCISQAPKMLGIFGGCGIIREKGGDMMSWGLFGQIVLLIAIFVFLKTVIKCMHDIFCMKCKK